MLWCIHCPDAGYGVIDIYYRYPCPGLLFFILTPPLALFHYSTAYQTHLDIDGKMWPLAAALAATPSECLMVAQCVCVSKGPFTLC